MTMEKHNSLQFLLLDRARFEEFGEKDGVLVRNVPYELRDRLLKWMWLHPSSRERYFFDDDRGRLAVTRAGWEKYINWVRRALDEKFSNDQLNSPKSAVGTLVPPLGKCPTLPQLVKEQEMKDAPGVRIVCISDTHNFHSQIDVPDGDVLIIAGDVCMRGSVYELDALDEFLGDLPHRHKLLVAGNHDWCFANVKYEEARKLLTNAIYLEDSGIEIEGVKYWGSPWQPEFHDWAFNLPRGRKLAEVWAKIPSDTDVLITHGPPFGILDKNGSGDHVGCGALLDALSRIQPRIHVFGHLHESYGTIEADGTTFINASICDGQYRPINKPIVIDLRLPA